jgi:glycosyltransferase involved in cell wall biosynthesis
MSIYNNENTVDASIRSIAGQTFADWELILIDDASKDGSADKLLAWQAEDKRIRVYANGRNMGLAASLNRALQKAAGAYIARMDGDDISLPDRFQKQVDFLDLHPEFALVSAGCVLFDEQGAWGRRTGKAEPQKQDFLWGSQFLHPACMLRREALAACGGYRVSRETLRTEDYDLFMRMYAQGYKGYNLPEPLLNYYENRKPRRVKLAQRWSEAKTRYRGFKALGLLPGGFLYMMKPLVLWIVPGGLKRKLQHIAPATKGGG